MIVHFVYFVNYVIFVQFSFCTKNPANGGVFVGLYALDSPIASTSVIASVKSTPIATSSPAKSTSSTTCATATAKSTVFARSHRLGFVYHDRPAVQCFTIQLLDCLLCFLI